MVNNKVITTNIGVPQGGVLSPTLFNLYINNLIITIQQLEKTEILAFADDLVIYAKGDMAA